MANLKCLDYFLHKKNSPKNFECSTLILNNYFEITRWYNHQVSVCLIKFYLDEPHDERSSTSWAIEISWWIDNWKSTWRTLIFFFSFWLFDHFIIGIIFAIVVIQASYTSRTILYNEQGIYYIILRSRVLSWFHNNPKSHDIFQSRNSVARV